MPEQTYLRLTDDRHQPASPGQGWQTQQQQRDAEHALILHAMSRLGERLWAADIADEAGLSRRGIGQKLAAMKGRGLVDSQLVRADRGEIRRTHRWYTTHAGRQFAADRPDPASVSGEGDEGAMRWDGSLESIQAICAWANDPKDVSDPWVSFVIGDGVASEVQRDTVEGIVAVKPGDWIVRNAEREFSVARPVSVSTGGDERGTDAFGKRLSVTVGVRYADLEAECTECGALPVVLPFENGDAWCTQCAIDALTDRMEEEASPVPSTGGEGQALAKLRERRDALGAVLSAAIKASDADLERMAFFAIDVLCDLISEIAAVPASASVPEDAERAGALTRCCGTGVVCANCEQLNPDTFPVPGVDAEGERAATDRLREHVTTVGGSAYLQSGGIDNSGEWSFRLWFDEWEGVNTYMDGSGSTPAEAMEQAAGKIMEVVDSVMVCGGCARRSWAAAGAKCECGGTIRRAAPVSPETEDEEENPLPLFRRLKRDHTMPGWTDPAHAPDASQED